jgi:DNA-binding NtrC family response regulator
MSEEEKDSDEPSKAIKDGVLILDPDKLNLKVIKQILVEDYEVYLAASVREAFRVVDNYPIKVIVAEQSLARMTAVEFFEELEETGNYSTRIVMTDFKGHAVASKALEQKKIFFILIKPVDVLRLKQRIPAAIEDFEKRGGKPHVKRNLDDLL